MKSMETMEIHNFQCPIDETDAMARVLDPVRCLCFAGGRVLGASDRSWRGWWQVFRGINQGEKLFGVFLKDYMETEW